MQNQQYTWQQKTNGWLHDEENIKGFFGEYRWLSNFHVCPVWYNGIEFTSSEAAYQAAKLVDRNDRLQFMDIAPSEAKKLGRKIKIRPDWDEIKLGVMEEILLDKFSLPELRAKLIQTEDKYLEETNWWNDKFWGVCNGVGQNKLGQILMRIRNI